MLAGDVGGPVGGAVVDDEHVGVRQPGGELVEHRREVVLLVPRGDEDDRVGHGYILGRFGDRQIDAHSKPRMLEATVAHSASTYWFDGAPIADL